MRGCDALNRIWVPAYYYPPQNRRKAKRVRQEKGQSSRPMEPMAAGKADAKSDLVSALYLWTQQVIIKHTTLIRIGYIVVYVW